MAVKLFVGDGLRSAFAKYGTVASAQAVRGPDGRSRGFRFVEMAPPEDAEKAINVEKAGAPARPPRRAGAPTRW